MFRQLIELIRGFFRGLGSALRDIAGLFANFLGMFRLGNMRRVVTRDSADILASSQMVAFSATSTVANSTKLILFAPWYCLRWLFFAPRHAWYFLRTRTPLQIAIGILVFLVGSVAAGWPLVTVIHERRIEALRKEQYRQLDQHFARGNYEGAKHNLTVLRNATPNDPRISARLAALEAGDADKSDPKLARLLMRHHYGANRLPESGREAKKYLAMEPRDWEALLILADLANRQDQRAAALQYLEQLPKPTEPNDPVSIWSCSLAARLFKNYGLTERLDDLTDFVTIRFVPLVRDHVVSVLDPRVRLQIVEMYNLALERLAVRPQLMSFWVPIQEYCHGIAHSAESDGPVLARLGSLQEAQNHQFMPQMLHLHMMSSDEFKKFRTEIDDRLKFVWQRIAEIDPKNPFAFIGPAITLARKSDYHGALAIIDEGIAKAGKLPEFVEKKAEILRMVDPAGGLAFLESSIQDKTLTLPICRVMAEAAIAASRPDRAIVFLEQAHKIKADDPAICRLQADVLIKMGRYTEAAGILRRVLESVKTDPSSAGLYVQALASSGSVPLATQFLLEGVQQGWPARVIVGGCAAFARESQLEPALEVLQKLVRRDPLDLTTRVLLADCLRLKAERLPKSGWDLELVDEALRCYRMAQKKQPDNLQIMNNIAWLEFLALSAEQPAFDSTAKMRAVEDKLPPEMLSTVGMAYYGVGDFERAKTALEKAVEQGNRRAFTLATLALTYNALKLPVAAEGMVNMASRAPKASPREEEYVREAVDRIRNRARR